MNLEKKFKSIIEINYRDTEEGKEIKKYLEKGESVPT